MFSFVPANHKKKEMSKQARVYSVVWMGGVDDVLLVQLVPSSSSLACATPGDHRPPTHYACNQPQIALHTTCTCSYPSITPPYFLDPSVCHPAFFCYPLPPPTKEKETICLLCQKKVTRVAFASITRGVYWSLTHTYSNEQKKQTTKKHDKPRRNRQVHIVSESR